MAPKMIKSTFSLDVETARALEVLARRWKVSKSEAVRRAVGAVAEKESPRAQEAGSPETTAGFGEGPRS